MKDKDIVVDFASTLTQAAHSDPNFAKDASPDILLGATDRVVSLYQGHGAKTLTFIPDGPRPMLKQNAVDTMQRVRSKSVPSSLKFLKRYKDEKNVLLSGSAGEAEFECFGRMLSGRADAVVAVDSDPLMIGMVYTLVMKSIGEAPRPLSRDWVQHRAEGFQGGLDKRGSPVWQG